MLKTGGIIVLVCSKCGRVYPEDTREYRCACGGWFDYVFSQEPRFDKNSIVKGPLTLWRYADALPLPAGAESVTMGEGMTPLIPFEWGGRQILFKLDHVQPTGSYKDRGMAYLVSRLKAAGIGEVVEDSSGNAGAAMASYCARAGVTCNVYVPDYTSQGKCVQILASGAQLHRVPGSREDTTAAAMAAGATSFYASHNWSPWFVMGLATWAYEVWEQMGWAVPDTVVVPVGQGSIALGAWYGFQKLKAAGQIDRCPRIIAVQSSGCAPLAEAWERGLDEPVKIVKTSALAEGIASSEPVKGTAILKQVRASGGFFVSVTDEEVKKAFFELAHRGIYVEPTSAVVAAALTCLAAQGAFGKDEKIVAFTSGSGLKATDHLLDFFG